MAAVTTLTADSHIFWQKIYGHVELEKRGLQIPKQFAEAIIALPKVIQLQSYIGCPVVECNIFEQHMLLSRTSKVYSFIIRDTKQSPVELFSVFSFVYSLRFSQFFNIVVTQVAVDHGRHLRSEIASFQIFSFWLSERLAWCLTTAHAKGSSRIFVK